MRRPRIKDVADLAGVSTATVSLVLNNVPTARVSPETRERVLSAALRLGYAPNAIGRSLRTQRTRTIGFISDVIAATPYAGRMVQGAQDAAWRAGHLLFLVDTGGDVELEARAIEALRAQQVDGIVYATMYHRVVGVPAGLAPDELVLLDARPASGPIPFVVPDEVGGAVSAVNELTGHGHRRIGFATDRRRDVPAAAGRLAGYRSALQAAGIAYEPELVVGEDSDTPGGYRAVGQLLDLADPPTAVFCFNDRMAMGAYRAAAERGLRIPADVSIVGFDDQELIAAALSPGLTTVALPHHAMGEWAVRTLLAIVAGQQGGSDGPEAVERQFLMPCPLVRRDSVGPPTR
jgi:LacI family transcriptional regulator, galactose operon repressor